MLTDAEASSAGSVRFVGLPLPLPLPVLESLHSVGARNTIKTCGIGSISTYSAMYTDQDLDTSSRQRGMWQCCVPFSLYTILCSSYSQVLKISEAASHALLVSALRCIICCNDLVTAHKALCMVSDDIHNWTEQAVNHARDLAEVESCTIWLCAVQLFADSVLFSLATHAEATLRQELHAACHLKDTTGVNQQYSRG